MSCKVVKYITLLCIYIYSIHIHIYIWQKCLHLISKSLVSSSPVQAQSERWFVLPHFSCDIIPASQLVAEASTIRIQHDASHAAQGFSGQKLHLCIGIIGLHQAGRMNLRGEGDGGLDGLDV